MKYNSENKRIIIADLDGTLTLSKTLMDKEMSKLISELLKYKDFAVISGGSYPQFQKQFVEGLSCPKDRISRLYLFPTCATTMYRFKGDEWTRVYAENLTEKERKKIFDGFEKALKEVGFKKPEKLYGEMIEDRGTQVTFSTFGQQAPLELKKSWDPDQKKRLEIKKHLDKILPEFEVRVGGATSIDVTKKGIDKAYGIRKIKEVLGYDINEMLFIGDAIFEGGNDYPVKSVGVESFQVEGPEETKVILKEIISESIGHSHTHNLTAD